MLNEEQLEQLKEFGAAFTNLADAAMILEVDEFELRMAVSKTKTPEHQAYHGGRLQSEFETRQAIVKQATAGSSPAQVLAMKLINELNMNDA